MKVPLGVSLFLCVFSAGADATTIYIPNNKTTHTVSGLTFDPVTIYLDGISPDTFTKARLFVGVTGVPSVTAARFTSLSLAGQGITSSLNWSVPRNPEAVTTGDQLFIPGSPGLSNVNDISLYTGTVGSKSLDTNVEIWNTAQNTGSFTFEILSSARGPFQGDVDFDFQSALSGFIPGGAEIHYAMQYSYDSAQINTAFGNTTIKSVWQWDLYSNESSANGGTAGSDWTVTHLRAQNVTISPGEQFNIDLGAGVDFGAAFWNANRSWSFSTSGTSGSITGGDNFVLNFQGAGYDSTYDPAEGFFTFNGTNNTLNWTAIPEPTSALSGLLLAAGLMRRRRR
jgi:hypothetical protein